MNTELNIVRGKVVLNCFFVLEINVGGGLNCAKVYNNDLINEIERPQR